MDEGAKVIKAFKESFPPLRLIGRRYTDADRGPDGGFSQKWGEWFERGWFQPLEQRTHTLSPKPVC
jgi:hypothetical protein